MNGAPIKLELTHEGLLDQLYNHYTTGGAYISFKFISPSEMFRCGFVLWHIKTCRLLIPNPLYTYISTTYDLVYFGFNDILTPLGYLMPVPLYIYASNIYGLVLFGFMAYQTLQVI